MMCKCVSHIYGTWKQKGARFLGRKGTSKDEGGARGVLYKELYWYICTNHHNETHYPVSYLKQQKQVNQYLCFIVAWIRNDLTLNVWTFGPSVHCFGRLQEVEPWWGSVSLRMGFAVCQPRPTFCSLSTSWVQMNCEQLGSYSCSQVFAVTVDRISFWNCKSIFPPQSCCMSRFFIAATED